MRTREARMTIYKIEADLHDVTTPGGPQEYVPGYKRASAQGGGEFHTWQLRADENPIIGQVVTVVVIEHDEPDQADEVLLAPPPIIKRSRP